MLTLRGFNGWSLLGHAALYGFKDTFEAVLSVIRSRLGTEKVWYHRGISVSSTKIIYCGSVLFTFMLEVLTRRDRSKVLTMLPMISRGYEGRTYRHSDRSALYVCQESGYITIASPQI